MDKTSDFISSQILNHCLPISFMQLYKDFLLIAEGPSLLIRNTRNIKLPYFLRYQIFSRVQTIQKVEVVETHCSSVKYGFKKSEDGNIVNILLWAGSVLKLVYLNLSTEEITISTDSIFNEFDFLPIAVRCLDEGKQIAILSALNYLFIYEFDENIKQYVRSCSYHGTRAHLYCGIMSGSTLNDLIVFSGTAYREINVWIISANQPNHLQTLKGHNGVALSLDYYEQKRTLISVSDDRSTILWQLKEGSNVFELKSKFFCPDARIWKSIFAGDVILSVGEGSVIAIHDFEGKLIKTWKGHHGASIYQCSFQLNGYVLYTGAYDGSVVEWPNCLEKYQTKRLPLDVNCQGKEIMKLVGKDHPRSIVQYDLFNTIVAMDSGRILVCNPNRPDTLLFDSPALSRYSVMALSPLKDMLLVGSLNGELFNLQVKYDDGHDAYRTIVAERDQHRPWSQVIKSSKKIVSLLWIHPFRSVVASLDEVFVLEFSYTNEVVNRYIHDMEENQEISKEMHMQIEVVHSKFLQKFIVELTSPGISAALEIEAKHIILGNDDGNIVLFKYGQDIPVFEVRKAHRYGVTSFVRQDNKIFSCGRNGIVRVYTLDLNDGSDTLTECSNYTMPFEWVDQLYIKDDDLLVCGFSSTSFVIYCWKEKRVLTEIENCGGGHRSWDLNFAQNGVSVFSYIRDKEVFYTRLQLHDLMGRTLKSGVHSKTINCAISIGCPKDNIYFFASGSEDGTIRTFFWDNNTQEIIMNNMFNNHISSVRSLALLQDPKDESGDTFFLFSGGGRSQIIAWKIHKHDENSYSKPKSKVNFRAEIEMCGEQSLCDIPKKVKFSIDTRIMYISVATLPGAISSNNSEIVCFCACSDGYVRVLSYMPLKKRFDLIAIMNGVDHAVMRVHADFEFNQKHIIGVSSNGYLIIWKWRQDLLESRISMSSKKDNVFPIIEPIYKKRIQKSAIMTLDVVHRRESDNDIYLIIGTDDTSVANFQLKIEEENVTCSQIWNKSFMKHRGAVVSVNCTPDLSNVISCSNDQVLSYWDFNGELMATSYSGVTDCQGLVFLKDFSLCFGNGISFVSTPKTLK